MKLRFKLVLLVNIIFISLFVEMWLKNGSNPADINRIHLKSPAVGEVVVGALSLAVAKVLV